MAEPSLFDQTRDPADVYMESVRGAIRIPARTPARPCKLCEEDIYDVPPIRPGGKPRVASIKRYKEGYPWGVAPTETKSGAGIDHHANCEPFLAKHRK